MDKNFKSNLSTPPDAQPKTRHSRSPAVSLVSGILVLLALGVGAYSVYVAVHEPDPQETVVLGQTKLAAGSPAGLRVIVRNRLTGRPVKDAEVVLSLRNRTSNISLGTFRTESTGSLNEPITISNIPPGEFELVLESRSSLGHDRIARKVQVQHPARILLSTDKPIYQPGQTIHLRSLTLNGRTQKPFAGEAVTFEVKDPKGNKVFKQTENSSDFGIASADFVLASELNLGRYEIRALAGAVTAERTVEVNRYMLPKFKIQITTDRSYYLPGQTVSGSVQASYFFGRPVSGATAKLTAATYQEKPVLITELEGRTDAQGKFSFQFRLPGFFVGLPQKNEQAFLDLTAEIGDTAQHVEEKTLSLSVARSELELTVVPEAGVLVPGVENILYVLAAYPDGRPAVCTVFLNGSAYQGDPQGVSEVKLGPAEANRQLEFQAIDAAGRKARLVYSPDINGPKPAILLRTDKAVYQAGQAAQLTIISPEKQNTVFIDVIKDDQTVLTRSVALANQKASYALSLPATLVGALKMHAYFITGTGEDRGCSRIIYVNPASGLRVAAKLAKEVYRPGEVAKLDFLMTDPEGRPAPAALGIAAVDESVFSLSENRPGLLQQFLEVEGELLKPRHQIKSFACPGQFLSDAGGNQALAQAYFASLGRQPAEPDLNELVKAGYISQRVLDDARRMRGSPAYERLRQNPDYAEVLRLLDGESGTYSLREATGPVKVQSIEAHRKAYFQKLKRDLQIGFVVLLFFSPVLLLFYYSRPGAGINPEALAQGQSARYVELAGSSYNLLGVLTLLPLVCYPLGFLVLERSTLRGPGWLLLAFESAVVLGTLAVQFLRLQTARADMLEQEMRPVRAFLGAFVLQFILSRAGFSWMAISQPGEGFALLWFLGSITAPLLVLGGLGTHVRRQLAAKGITAAVARVTVVEVLIIICIFFVLAAMLLPALARAKARGQHISFMNDLAQINLANRMAKEDGLSPEAAAGSPAPPRVRRDFPETLLWRPELITDDRGQASLEIPLADSITTWRASVDGISAAGQMGSAEVPITVFQDFFVDLDLPVSMSLGDQVSVPLTCYNYLKEPQDVRLTVAPADWFESTAPNFGLRLGPGEVKSADFRLKVLRVGNHKLRVTAQGTRLADALEREIRVVPTGERIERTCNGVLKDNWTDTFTLGPESIPDSQSLWVKFYPSRFSEIVEGLESIFQAPYGCFEQTSSTTYPNVLVLDYMKRMGRLTPEIEIKARKFINAGYQRLLTFEVPGGGFEWFGRPPANICLTAYGILEFTDMARVHPVDEAVTERARKWLFAQQSKDGSWDEPNRGWTWAGRGSMTAFVAWALAESGDQSPNLDRALDYLRTHPAELATTYSKALAANAFLARDRNDSFGRELAGRLKDAAIPGGGQTLHWSSDGYSVTYSHGSGMDVETAALAAIAMMKAGIGPQSVKEALTWISNEKSCFGTWGSTQATILAMRALLAGSTAALGQEFDSTVTLLINGDAAETFHLNKENSDVMKQFDLTQYVHTGDNQIEFRQVPAGELPFQVAGAYWLPAASSDKAASVTSGAGASATLEIDVQYDRTQLSVNEQLRCDVSVRNNTGQVINMAIVDLGIPPGFDVDSTSFEALQQASQIAKFETTGNQVILYLRQISNVTPFQFSYSLRAKYPLRVQTPPSAVYEYYQPKNRAQTKPVTLEAL